MPSPQGQPDQGQRRVGPFPAGAVRLVSVIAFVAGLYGIAQPAILRLFGVGDNEDLKVADILSILITVLALLAASFGVVIYEAMKRTLDQRLATAISDSKQERDYELADAMLNVTAFAVSEAWQRLEPFLVDPPDSGSVGVALRDSIIDYGFDSASDAKYWLDRCDEAHRLGNQWPVLVDLNQALFLACRAHVGGASGQHYAADARRLLPTVDQVASDEAKDTIAWVRVCCYPVGSEEWEEGRTLALRLMHLVGTESKRAIMHLRYEKAFPGSF